jgi:uncharacterized protein YndB with AHSA1/START domain
MSKQHETTLVAPDGQPTMEIIREFDAPRERVFRAHVDPELVRQWLGPRRLTMEVDQFDIRRGGSYAYRHIDQDGTTYGFWGAVHEVRPYELIIQTFGFDGAPDDAFLEKTVFEDLGDGRTRVRVHSVVQDVNARDAILASGMQEGLDEGYEQLDELLAAQRAEA